MAKVLSMAMYTAQPLGLTGILRESFLLPSRNVKLMVSSTLLVLFPFLILTLSHNLIAGPFLMEVEDNEVPIEDLTAEFHKHVQILMLLEAIFFLLFCILSIFAMAMTIYASSATYSGTYLNLRDVFARTVTTWKRPVITSFYIALVTIYCGCLSALVFLGFLLMAKNSAARIAWISLVGVSEVLLCLYFAVVCLMGLVISIVEEDFYGMKALEKAEMLIKGRRLQGLFLMLLLVLLSVPVWALFCINTVEDAIGTTAWVAMGIVEASLVCLMMLFTFVVFTVFYYQCKWSSGERKLERGSDVQISFY